MSDNWIRLIPERAGHVPDPARQLRARDRFAELAPEADEVSVHVSEHIELVDCGANLERIVCPSCRSEIAMAWWEQTIERDFAQGFTLAAYPTPCCGARHTLHELAYEMPQGFGRFVLEALNPNLGVLEPRIRLELEDILGTPLRVIYQHL